MQLYTCSAWVDPTSEASTRTARVTHDVVDLLDPGVLSTLICRHMRVREREDYLNSLSQEVKWIYLTYEGERGREAFHVKDFEQPIEEKVLHLDTSKISIEECVTKIEEYVGEKITR